MCKPLLISSTIIVVTLSPCPAPVTAASRLEQSTESQSDEERRRAVTQPSSSARESKTRHRKVIIELNGGAIRPGGSMRLWTGFDGKPLFSETGSGGISLGLRVARFVQIDLGMELSGPVVGPDRNSYDERLMRLSFGTWVARDPRQPLEDPVSDGAVLLVPFGLRFVVPMLDEHFLIGIGGGGSFLHHGEANDREHPTLGRGCAASCENRYGLGGYGLARLEFIPGAERRVGIGVVSRYTRARLSGGGYLPLFSRSGARDEWLQVGGTISVRF
jgi:hypothetical protein